MFKFIKSRLGGVKPVVETQRKTVERALGEANEILALMAVKPKITIDPETGTIAVEMPDQMPDEALALPAPEPEVVPDPDPVADDVVADPASEKVA